MRPGFECPGSFAFRSSTSFPLALWHCLGGRAQCPYFNAGRQMFLFRWNLILEWESSGFGSAKKDTLLIGTLIKFEVSEKHHSSAKIFKESCKAQMGRTSLVVLACHWLVLDGFDQLLSFLHYPLTLAVPLLINLSNIEFWKNMGTPRIKPGAGRWVALTLPLCYAVPPYGPIFWPV